jgi:hypothetical protein
VERSATHQVFSEESLAVWEKSAAQPIKSFRGMVQTDDAKNFRRQLQKLKEILCRL